MGLPGERKPKIATGGGLHSPLGVLVMENDAQTMAFVREALDLHRLRLAYQPVVVAQSPEKIAFYEGLIRILDPNGRVIPAKDFIEAIEDGEMGREVDCASLEMGLAALARYPDLRLSINMSARSIGHKNWMKILENGLSVNETVPERLILEITESSAMIAPDRVVTFMDDLQKQGVAFALDDFGSGYTAIRYFKEFFFDILKLDGQFVRKIHQDPDNQALTAALLSIGKHFQMFTVAEMIETPEEAGFLRDMGVDCLQGYLFGAASMRPAFMTAEPAKKRA